MYALVDTEQPRQILYNNEGTSTTDIITPSIGSGEIKTVRDYASQELRGTTGKVKRHDSSKDQGFEGILVDNLASMAEILEVIETNALYRLLYDNCQTTVENFQNTVAQKSLELCFHVPGSELSIPLTDPKVVGVVEDLHPDWKAGQVQQFPEMSNPFAIEAPVDAADNVARKANYGVLVQKQRVLEAVMNALKTSAEDDEPWQKMKNLGAR